MSIAPEVLVTSYCRLILAGEEGLVERKTWSCDGVASIAGELWRPEQQ